MVMIVMVPGGGGHVGLSSSYTYGGYIAANDEPSSRHNPADSGLPDIPVGGIYMAMKDNGKTSTIKRLSRIEGQVRGLARMVEDDRYCIDIVTQIGAVKAALRRVEEEILREHVAHCVEHAIKSGDKADQRRKVAELMDVMSRAAR